MRRKTRKRNRRAKNKQRRRNRRKNRQPQKKSALEWNKDKKFIQRDGARFKIYPMRGDGNCLFRAMSYFVLGRQADHDFIRKMVVKHVCDNWDRFRNFATESNAEDYASHMNSPRTYGGEAEIVAFTEIFGLKVQVFFQDFPQRSALTFGDSSTTCYVMYSGMADNGHYDVLLPTTKKVCNVQLYRESIRQLREATAVVFERDLADFRENKK
ncbi:hypothetical protein AVEN_117151-1 [Araneus ventricosus]|uniref:OTU domain-containing protein n=1 Tax=Araneus ventricosus TaxID=182803 RepID=A0A4Y2AXW3_ARAVE|nr:hypothetical protein AVEN_117151-1 [Araneus ventricosus]